MVILSEIDASKNGGMTNVSRPRLYEWSHCRGMVRRIGRRIGFQTAMDEIPYVIFHSWISQPFWVFPFCEESRNLKAVVSLKRRVLKNICADHRSIRRVWKGKAETHCILKATKCINVSVLRFTCVLLSVALTATIALKQTTLWAHANSSGAAKCTETAAVDWETIVSACRVDPKSVIWQWKLCSRRTFPCQII